MTYVYIGSRTQLFGLDMTKSFLKKHNVKPYSDSICSGKNQIVRFGKADGPVFATLTSCLIFFYLGPLMPFSPFSCSKAPWIFKSSCLAPSSVLLQNCQNRKFRNGKPDSSVSPACQIWSSTHAPLPFS
jgi:hypothetical protein